MTKTTVTIDDVDAQLPQTQCGECGYDGCRPYAEALVAGDATINLCPPGGTETLTALANLLNQDARKYVNEVNLKTRPPSVVTIREEECIGCTKCIQACPVDAILGSGKLMHTVIQQECTGCNLCIPPCPVDCIDIKEITTPHYDKITARKRFESRKIRLNEQEKTTRMDYKRNKTFSANKLTDKQEKQAYIRAAITRSLGKKLEKQKEV